VGVYQDAVVLC